MFDGKKSGNYWKAKFFLYSFQCFHYNYHIMQLMTKQLLGRGVFGAFVNFTDVLHQMMGETIVAGKYQSTNWTNFASTHNVHF